MPINWRFRPVAGAALPIALMVLVAFMAQVAPMAACAQTLAPQAGHDVQAWAARKPTPALIATDLNGKEWRLADLRGRAVLVNFWASWCEPCRAEMPSLQRLAEQHAGDVVVLAVNFKEPTASVQRFVHNTGLNLPVLQDPQGNMARAFGVRIFPSTVMIGRDGRVHSVVRGELDWTGVDAEELLAPLRKPVHKLTQKP
jgi:thiol-disulfide isomerase/thioredoxin